MSNTQLKIIVDEYFSTRINDLKTYYKKFAKPSELNFFGEMMSILYMHIIDKMDKLYDVISTNNIHFYAIQFIYNQRNWNGTDFKKTIFQQETNNDLIPDLKLYYESSEEIVEEQLEKDFDRQNKLAKINIALSTKLDLHEKILYDLYYIKRKSLREIADDTGISHTGVYYMVKKIRTTIKNTKLK